MKAKYRTWGLTPERLRSVLDYDPATGIFRWKQATSKASRVKIGDIAGCLHKSSGYIVIWLDMHPYQAQCLAWLYVRGKWCPEDVDHENQNKTDNSELNLRSATTSQNKANGRVYANKPTGLPKGVTKNGNKYRAQIVKNYKHTHLGYFDNPEDAHAAYASAAKRVHGKFAYVERPRPFIPPAAGMMSGALSFGA